MTAKMKTKLYETELIKDVANTVRQEVIGFQHRVKYALIFHLITKTRLFKYIENFTAKNWKFSDKNL